MHFNKRILGIAILGAAISTVSCKKDSNSTTNNTNNVVTKNGIAMNGGNEVPAKNTAAYGTMNVSYNKSTKALDVSVTYYNLTGAPVGAHIHGPAPAGMNAGVVVDLSTIIPSTVSGSFSTSTTADGTNIIADSLLAGKYYLNIHTPTNQGGEIRGQITF